MNTLKLNLVSIVNFLLGPGQGMSWPTQDWEMLTRWLASHIECSVLLTEQEYDYYCDLLLSDTPREDIERQLSETERRAQCHLHAAKLGGHFEERYIAGMGGYVLARYLYGHNSVEFVYGKDGRAVVSYQYAQSLGY